MGALMRHIVLIALLAWVPSSRAIVYTLRPGQTAKSVESALSPRQVLEDELLVNGERGRLTVALTSLTFEEALAALKPLLAKHPGTAGHRSLMIDVSKDERWVTRYLVLSTGDKAQTVVFQLHMPRTAMELASAPHWPDALPRPPADRLGPVMVLGQRGTSYATFSSSDRVNELSRRYHTSLVNAGWRPLGGRTATGGVYVDQDNHRMVTVSTISTENGSEGAVMLTRFSPWRGE